MIDDGKLGVFDWEESSAGLPFIDIFHYFTVSGFTVDFSGRDKKLSKESRYRVHFLENVGEILSLIADNYDFLGIDKKLFSSAYIFYLAHMAVNEIKRDCLVNDFEFWLKLLKIFLSKSERS